MSINYPTLYTSSASPQVILGDDIMGQGADDARQGFRKYNSHIHLPFSSTNFFTYNIALGDEVFIYDDNGISVFPQVDAPVIDYISQTQLRINTTSNVDLENVLLYVKAPLEDMDNSIVITGVDLVAGSNLITFNPDTPRSGFLTTDQHKLLAEYQVSQSFTLTDVIVPKRLPILLSVGNPSWLKGAGFYLTDAAAEIKLVITRAATQDVIESESITLTDRSVTSVDYIEQVTDPLKEVFDGILTNPLMSGDLIEVVIDNFDFEEDKAQAMLVGTLDLLRVL